MGIIFSKLCCTRVIYCAFIKVISFLCPVSLVLRFFGRFRLFDLEIRQQSGSRLLHFGRTIALSDLLHDCPYPRVFIGVLF